MTQQKETLVQVGILFGLISVVLVLGFSYLKNEAVEGNGPQKVEMADMNLDRLNAYKSLYQRVKDPQTDATGPEREACLAIQGYWNAVQLEKELRQLDAEVLAGLDIDPQEVSQLRVKYDQAWQAASANWPKGKTAKCQVRLIDGSELTYDLPYDQRRDAKDFDPTP